MLKTAKPQFPLGGGGVFKQNSKTRIKKKKKKFVLASTTQIRFFKVDFLTKKLENNPIIVFIGFNWRFWLSGFCFIVFCRSSLNVLKGKTQDFWKENGSSSRKLRVCRTVWKMKRKRCDISIIYAEWLHGQIPVFFYAFSPLLQVQKLQNIIASRATQYNHDMKRKERDLYKLKERLNQLLADKKERKQGKKKHLYMNIQYL